MILCLGLLVAPARAQDAAKPDAKVNTAATDLKELPNEQKLTAELFRVRAELYAAQEENARLKQVVLGIEAQRAEQGFLKLLHAKDGETFNWQTFGLNPKPVVPESEKK
jgi:outer membrane murein-binding lipoprotein Lpp